MPIVDGDVKAVIDTTRDTAPFIATAQLLADEELADKGLSTERLDKIVLYLAAHFVCVTEEKGGLKQDRLLEAESTFKTPADDQNGLASTRYGQQAMILDTSGSLAKLSAKGGLKAKFTVLEQCGNERVHS